MVLDQALHWMNEHEQVPTVSDPATSNALTGETSKCWNLAEARGLMNVSHGKFRKRAFSEEEKAEIKVKFLYCQTNRMDDLRAFQDQRFGRYSSGPRRLHWNRAQERQRANFRHEVGRNHHRDGQAAR